MAIVFACSCGQRLSAKDEFAGSQIQCPNCGIQQTIPQANDGLGFAPTHEFKEGPPEPLARRRRSDEFDDDEFSNGGRRRSQIRPISKGLYQAGIVGSYAVVQVLGLVSTFLLPQAVQPVPGAMPENLALLLVLQCPITIFSISYIVFTAIFAYRIWEALDDGNSRLSPGMATGLLFIPFFTFYWIFPVFWGWAQDYNAYLERNNFTYKRMSEGLAFAACIAAVADAISTILIMLPFGWTDSDAATLIFQALSVLGFIPMALYALYINAACNGIKDLSQAIGEA